ncbi:MAG: dihydrolipoyl dehydrogenase [Chloroflexi bacterium]|nr:dihydrolipoyl dehydrogenase [Chloroflexota bacterium]
MTDYDVAVIGSGPGGYPAAIRAAQLGLSTVCIEREFLGGICLNLGCIPSKALLRNAEVLSTVRNASEYGIEVSGVTANYAVGVARSRKVVERLTKGVASLFRRDGVAYVEGNATITGPREVSVDGERIGCQNIIIATGARPALPPPLAADGEVVVTYREVIVDEQVPGRVVIVGGGATGIEFAYLYNVYGAQVTLVEFLPRILPKEDEEISQALSRALGSQGIRLLTGASVTAVAVQDGTARVTIAASDETLELEADRVLVAAGITPNTDGLGVENAGGTLERGFIRVDDRLRVNGENVYAVGDVNGRLPLAHVAHAEGVYAAEHIGGLNPPALDYPGMPRATYCNPQVASIGLTESEAREQGYPIKVGKFPFLANGKALAVGHREGFAKIVADSSTGELLGAHLIGHEVTELLGELSMARLLDGTDVEIGRLVNVHPSMSEAVKEAALAAV